MRIFSAYRSTLMMNTAISRKPAIGTLLRTLQPPRPLALTKQTGVAVLDSSDASLVRYVTIEELMRSRASSKNRMGLLTAAVLTTVALCLSFRFFDYERVLRASQDRSIANLATALANEDTKVKFVITSFEGMTNDTSSRVHGLEQQMSANDRATRMLMDRLTKLEASKVVTLSMNEVAPQDAESLAGDFVRSSVQVSRTSSSNVNGAHGAPAH
jgi:hypothetical protein